MEFKKLTTAEDIFRLPTGAPHLTAIALGLELAWLRRSRYLPAIQVCRRALTKKFTEGNSPSPHPVTLFPRSLGQGS